MKNEKQKEIRYFSMFTGVGGFELGLRRANNDKFNTRTQNNNERNKSNTSTSDGKGRGSCSNGVRRIQQKNKERQNSGKLKDLPRKDNRKFNCVGFSEIDKYCNELLKNKFPKIKNYGDATRIIPKKLPDFNLLVGGFPCQAFSIAGKRKGFEDTRGTLFHEIVRVLKVKRPNYLLLENVKGLLSHDRGRTFAIILASLSKLGYVIQWMVLNSKFFGVPQNRERVFIIGSLREEPIPEILPLGEINQEFNKERIIHPSITGAIGRQGSSKEYMKSLQQINSGVGDAQRVFNPGGIAPTLKGLGGGQGAKTGLYMIAPNKKQIDLTKMPDRPFQLTETRTEKGKQSRREIRKKEGRDSTLRGKDDKKYVPLSEDIANCITTGKENIEKWTFENMKIRRLTPIECERLQGFPDNWTEGFSDTQRYKMMGNAVTVNVIKAIAERLITQMR